MSEEYSEEYREEYRDFVEVLKRTHNWIHRRGALNSSVWRGQAILPLLLQSKLPHCQQDCLAELQCQYLPPWSCQTLSSGCQCCTNLNLIVILCRLVVSPLLAVLDSSSSVQYNFSPGTRPRRSPTYSPKWVTLYDFSAAFRVSVVVVRLRRLLSDYDQLPTCSH